MRRRDRATTTVDVGSKGGWGVPGERGFGSGGVGWSGGCTGSPYWASTSSQNAAQHAVTAQCAVTASCAVTAENAVTVVGGPAALASALTLNVTLSIMLKPQSCENRNDLTAEVTYYRRRAGKNLTTTIAQQFLRIYARDHGHVDPHP